MKNKKYIIAIILSVIVIIGYLVIKETKYLNSEQGISQTLEENYDLFSEVATYIENDPGSFYLNYNIINLLTMIDSQKFDINNYPMNKQIIYIIKHLHFVGIFEDDDRIYFVKTAGSFEQGLIYSKGEIPIEEKNGFPGKIALIQDYWYYYNAYHT